MLNHLWKNKTKCNFFNRKRNFHKGWIGTFRDRKFNFANLKLNRLILLGVGFSIHELKITSCNVRSYTKEKCILRSFFCFIFLECCLNEFFKFFELFVVQLSVSITKPSSFFLFKFFLSNFSYNFLDGIYGKLHKLFHLDKVKNIC